MKTDMSKFRLATLLKMRERERNQAGQRVQDARLAIDKLEMAKREILAQNEEMSEMRKCASQGTVNMRNILDTQRFQMTLLAQVQQIDQHLGELRQELQRRELALVHCQQEVKSLEKLREQRREEAESRSLLQQQERTDEWASIRFAMDIQRDSEREQPKQSSGT